MSKAEESIWFPKRAQMAYLANLGYATPDYQQGQEESPKGMAVVEHFDEASHGPEGSRMCSSPTDKFWVQYLWCGFETTEGPCSWRHLVVGDRVFCLLVESNGVWRSNRGAVSVRLLAHRKRNDIESLVPLSLFAIDLLPPRERLMAPLAIGFDPAPTIMAEVAVSSH